MMRRARRSGRGRLILLVGVLLAAIFAIIVTVSVRSHVVPGEAQPAMSEDELQIRQVLTDFAIATDNADIPRMRELLCPDEAAEFDEYEYDPDQIAVPEPIDTVDMTISQMTVHGQYASAIVTRNEVAGPQQLFLQQIDGSWRVCADAQTQIVGTPTD